MVKQILVALAAVSILAITTAGAAEDRIIWRTSKSGVLPAAAPSTPPAGGISATWSISGFAKVGEEFGVIPNVVGGSGTYVFRNMRVTPMAMLTTAVSQGNHVTLGNAKYLVSKGSAAILSYRIGTLTYEVDVVDAADPGMPTHLIHTVSIGE
ncbi:hypothetical protein ACCS37_32275 [Rhizobium ruizarguesonis]